MESIGEESIPMEMLISIRENLENFHLFWPNL